jgi:tetraacyldisaccharide 4'-kinase
MSAEHQSGLQRALLEAWTQRGVLASLLWPVSMAYRAAVGLRRQMYRWGLLRTERVDALVLVVGNVIAGGAGKTPTVIELAMQLRKRGRLVGVISRGYGRTGDECLEVQLDSNPKEVGDEPLIIQRATGVPVFVGPTRAKTAKELLKAYPQTQVLLCDDGLQDYSFYRDMEICVFDDRGTGNGWLLPAGPLRESWPRKTVQSAGASDECSWVLHTGTHPRFAGFGAKRELSPYALKNNGDKVALARLMEPGSKPLMALAGIARPEAFFSMLKAAGLSLERTLSLPDHYAFDSYPRNVDGGYQLICTEKDAAKLWQHDPDALAVPLVQTSDPALFSVADACIQDRLAQKLSSRHGHQTT